MSQMKRSLILVILAVVLAPCYLYAQAYSVRAYIANYGTDTVSVIDDESRQVIATVTTGSKPSAIAISPDCLAVYVANEGAKSLSVIDPVNNQLVATINLIGSPRGIVVSSDSNFVYVAIADQNALEIIDARTKTSVGKIAIGRGPSQLAVSVDGKEIYACCEGDNALVIVDTVKKEQAAVIGLFGTPTSLTTLGDGNLVLTIRWLNGYTLVDPVARKITRGWVRPDFTRPGEAGRPFALDGAFAAGVSGYSSGPSLLWISQLSQLVYDLDTSRDNYILGFAPTGSMPWAVGVTPNGKMAYVTNSGDGSVSIIETALHAPINKLTVGQNPRALAVGRVRIVK
jgi:YVTN family beta-propeller protein